MGDRRLEGQGSEERLNAVRKGFRQTSRRLRKRDRLDGCIAMGRFFIMWFAGLALFAVTTLLVAEALL